MPTQALLLRSPIYISALMLLVLLLAARVSLLRKKTGIVLGDGGDKDLFVAIRRHGNSLEHALVLSVLALTLDLVRKPSQPLDLADVNWRVAGEGLVILGVVSRFAYAAFSFRGKAGHAITAAVTYLAEGGVCAVILVIALFY